MGREYGHFKSGKVTATPMERIDPGYKKDELKPVSEEPVLREVQKVSGHIHKLEKEPRGQNGLTPVVCLLCGYGKSFTDAELETLDLSKGQL